MEDTEAALPTLSITVRREAFTQRTVMPPRTGLACYVINVNDARNLRHDQTATSISRISSPRS
jgi:hypothetical protein